MLGKTLLLVEDEAILAMVTQRQLENYNYRVVHVFNGEAAIAQVKNNPVDLVLMDINLGKGISGTEAAIQILECHDIPLIFLSSHTEKAIVESTEQITNYGYVVKNSEITVLDASIKMAFKLHAAKAQEHRALITLAKSEADYHSLFDHAIEGLFRTSLQGELIQANRAMINLLGFPDLESLKTHTPSTEQLWFKPDQRPAFIELLHHEKRIVGYLTQFCHRDGSAVPISLNVQIIFDANGQELCYEGFLLPV